MWSYSQYLHGDNWVLAYTAVAGQDARQASSRSQGHKLLAAPPHHCLGPRCHERR